MGFDLPPNAEGIDISSAQTPLDWSQVKAAGFSFAVIRATQGKADSKPVGLDTRFREHIEAALAVGMKVGVYCAFLGAVDGKAQADFFLSVITPYLDKLALPVAVDVEVSNDRSPELVADRLYALCRQLEERLGYKALIYTSRGFWNGHVGTQHDAYFAECDLWIASWTTSASKPSLPRCWSDWVFWQHEVRANGIPGYQKRLDLNKLNLK